MPAAEGGIAVGATELARKLVRKAHAGTLNEGAVLKAFEQYGLEVWMTLMTQIRENEHLRAEREVLEQRLEEATNLLHQATAALFPDSYTAQEIVRRDIQAFHARRRRDLIMKEDQRSEG